MKRLLYLLFFGLMTLVSMAQTPPVRLHVQASKAELTGDGDDYTTIVVTARDPEGEIITTMNGKVALRCSSGLLDESELQMNNGIAFTKYTAPIFGQPIKAAQRMVYFTVKFIRSFLSRFGGSTDEAANTKLAQKIALETFKEINPLTLMPQKNGDNNVYFVAEMNGLKGKTKVLIQKATEGGNSALMPGYYSGYDVTGQAHFELMLESGGKGQMTQGGTEAYSVLFTTEKSAEINSAMQKMMGGGEWMNAYMGASERDQQYMEGYDVKKNGLPSIYLPMPNNGIFLYIPPILLEYQGRPKVTPSGGTAGTTEEVEKKPRVFVTIEQNELIGDGRTQTKAIFHYEDENKVPVAGKNFTWNIPKEIKVISSQTATDASGNAIAVIQMPLLKAKVQTRGDMTGSIIDNTSLFRITTNFSTPKNQNESAYIDISVYKTIEKNLYILKPGFETSPYKVMLPQLEFYNLESSISAMISEGLLLQKSRIQLNDAVVFLESDNFEKEFFNQTYESFYKKDRKTFMSMLECPEGGFCAVTDAGGKFKLVVRDLEGKKRLYSGAYERTVPMDALDARLADLTGRRTGALTEVLGLVSGGKDASGNSDNTGTFSGEEINALDYKTKVYRQISDMEKILCTGSFDESVSVEEKLHILGMLMTNAKGTARFMGDTGKELIGHGWELLGMAWELANEHFKITESLGKKIGLDKVSDSLVKIGIKLDVGFWSKATGTDRKTGTKRFIMEQIKTYVLHPDVTDKIKASGAWYRAMGQAGEAISGFVFESLTEGISDAISDANPVPDMVVEALRRKYYAGLRGEIDRFLAQPPASVHAVYPQLQPALHDRSTEIRTYYQSIAGSRFNWEMYKADWDYFRDVVVKGGIIVTDLYTMNWAGLKKHLEALDKFNKVCDAAYTGTLFAQEIYRYHYLWCESKGAFDIANRSISQGALVTSEAADLQGFSIFSRAYAAGPPNNTAIPGVSGLSGLDFSLQNGTFPVNSINKAIEAANNYEQWLQSNQEKLSLLTGFNPNTAGAFYKSAAEFESNLTSLVLNALTYAGDKSQTSRQAYEAAAVSLEKSAKEFSLSAGKAAAGINDLPNEIRITLPEAENTSAPVWKNPLYQKIGIGVLAFFIVCMVLVLVIRRKRSKSSSIKQQIQSPAAPRTEVKKAAAPVAQEVPFAAPTLPSQSPSPKFCPQCGAAFTPGKRFCGKCGYRIPS
jgi:hypothetical protein